MRLVKALLYRLMRDDVPPGVMEAHVVESMKCSGKTVEYSNEYLAEYAEELACRLTKPETPDRKDTTDELFD